MEDMDIKAMVKKLRRLNPNTRIRIEKTTEPKMIIARCADCDALHLPIGYYYFSSTNELTNVANNSYGPYATFTMMTEYDYLVTLA